MTPPSTSEAWREIANQFMTRWNFPHSCGALDGKHVACRCPNSSGSTYYNYKGFYSVVIMALVDADYKFIWADVGGKVAASDAQIYNGSELKECIDDGSIGFPPAEPLPNDNEDVPYYLIGDDAFAVRSNMMKPYSHRGMDDDERICDYRLSRARRVVENAFGILANRFQVLLTTMNHVPAAEFTMKFPAFCTRSTVKITRQ
ncbi:putative nuclease HARBI1 [Mercenaria mercenaria]|uniref:putative nuclease HARBI1 n=1 Tax=Mercenaria mercenaria TaxID=6596 RepID=UPI00234EB494|nr:putative nuclease HARBI1 [Mercenaria mercenaria]